MEPLLPVLSLAVVVSAALTIAGHYFRPPRPPLIYIFKPLTTILILVVAFLPGNFAHETYARAIAVGLLFSLFGDIFLVLPNDRFLFGLAAFLLAHLCYGFAFRSGATTDQFPLVLLALAGFGGLMLRALWEGLPASMRLPVALYVVIITLMAAMAVARALALPSTKTLSAAVGAVLFVASDASLAFIRFRKPLHLGQAAVLVTYFAAQLLIALSV